MSFLGFSEEEVPEEGSAGEASFTSTLASGIADSLGLDAASVEITRYFFGDGGGRRAGRSRRKLQEGELKIEFRVIVPDTMVKELNVEEKLAAVVETGELLEAVKEADETGTFEDKTMEDEIEVEEVAPEPVQFYDGAGPDGKCCPHSSHPRCSILYIDPAVICPQQPNNGPCLESCQVYSEEDWVKDRPWETDEWEDSVSKEVPCSGDTIFSVAGNPCPFYSNAAGECPPGCDGNFEMLAYVGDASVLDQICAGPATYDDMGRPCPDWANPNTGMCPPGCDTNAAAMLGLCAGPETFGCDGLPCGTYLFDICAGEWYDC